MGLLIMPQGVKIMPHSRHVESNGVLVTKFTGLVTLKELIEIQNELENYAHEGEIYELVLHPDDSRLLQNIEESLFSAENVQKILSKFKKGAIAFVAKSDFIYAICRQLQMRVANEYIQLNVFRTEETALKWLVEIKTLNASGTENG